MPKKTDKKPQRPAAKRLAVKTIDQMTFARLISQRLNLKLTDVISIIEEEQKLTMEYVKMGYKVIKKNYLTIEGRFFDGKKNWTSPLNGKTYTIPAKTRVLVRVGVGFKHFIENKQIPEKMCRFVAGAGNFPSSESA